MSEQNNPFMASMSETAEFERLEDGMYESACVGVTLRQFPDYNDRSKMVDKVQFIFQVARDGQCFYFRTRPLTPIINEKSNLFILLNGWTGVTLDKLTPGLDCSRMIGVKAQVVITTESGKDGKEYSTLANILKPKKGSKVAPVPDAIPEYLVRGVSYSRFAAGITIKQPEPTQAAPAATLPQGIPGGIAPTQAASQYAQQARNPYQPQAAPAIPPNANVSVNANPAGFMQPNMVTDTAPAPAPQQTGNPGADDSEDDLPF